MIRDLLDVAGPALAAPPSGGDSASDIFREAFAVQLADLLSQRNGFVAFDGALVVRPLSNPSAPMGLVEWNDRARWKYCYAESYEPRLFFGSDIFGVQFCLGPEGVSTFSLESCESCWVARNLEDWAAWLLSDPDKHVGHSYCSRWRAEFGPLSLDQRLMAKTPTVLGGSFEFDNMVARDELFQMQALGPIAQQIRDVPDRTGIVIKVTE